MTNYTVDLPESIFIRTVNGEKIDFRPGDCEAVLSNILIVGAKTVLTNVFNGGGKDATDTERLAALRKKLDAWARGEFNVVERGESYYTAWRDVFVSDCVAAGLTAKAADGIIKDKVTARLGKDAKATFAAYLDSMALDMVAAKEAKDTGEALGLLESYYSTEAEKRAKASAKVQAKIAAPKLDLSAFRKA